MEPTLRDGQGLIAIRGLRPRPGQIRCAPHPDGTRWVVKRVESVDGDRVVLGSDNPEHAIDSRHFGPVPTRGTYTVVLRVPLRLM
jgi:phage repressor protein C with HTH and peptisase S24 domain